MSVRVTLADAVDRYRREQGSASNAYEWYRKQAQRDGRVSLGGFTVSAVKVGRQWMVDAAEVERAIDAHRDRVAEQHHATDDYKAHVLRGSDGSTIQTDWGGYRISGDFHFAWTGTNSVPERATERGTAIRALSPPAENMIMRNAIRAVIGVLAVVIAR
jgi:hypothetical protein